MTNKAPKKPRSEKKVTLRIHPDGLYVLLDWFSALQDSELNVAPQDIAMQRMLADLLSEHQEEERCAIDTSRP
jgi:hypothetical protein